MIQQLDPRTIYYNLVGSDVIVQPSIGCKSAISFLNIGSGLAIQNLIKSFGNKKYQYDVDELMRLIGYRSSCDLPSIINFKQVVFFVLSQQ